MGVSPLPDAGSPLDQGARNLISDLYDDEHRRPLLLPTDDDLDPKRRLRVDLTMTEIQGQPMSIRKTLDRERRALGDIVQSIASRPMNRV